jgi:hypothetical protein
LPLLEKILEFPVDQFNQVAWDKLSLQAFHIELKVRNAYACVAEKNKKDRKIIG